MSRAPYVRDEGDGLTLCGKPKRLRVEFDSSRPEHREAHFMASLYLPRLNAQSVHLLRVFCECLLEEQTMEAIEAEMDAQSPHRPPTETQ